MSLRTIFVASSIIGFGDLISQKIEKIPLNYNRTVKMMLLGGFTNGLCLPYWYTYIHKIFKNQSNIVIKKILADQVIYAPFSILFYLSVTSKQIGSIEEYKKHCYQSFFSIWISDCFFWPIFNYINFSYINVKNQYKFTSIVDLTWNTYLCYKLYAK